MGIDKKTVGAFYGLLVLISVCVTCFIGSESTLNARSEAMQYVLGDRIFDGNGSEVTWRGVGGSYLFSAGDRYREAWQMHLPEIQAMELNTIRLAFRFPWDTVSTGDVLDYAKLAWVVDFLGKNNIKSILDNHGGMGFGSDDLLHSWRELAAHYVGDTRIAAYELFNEPGISMWDSQIRNGVDAAKAYMLLTQSVREVDPHHIVVWQTPPYYIAPFEDISEYLQPNVVYTLHRWWTERKWEFDIWTPEQLSYMTLSYLVEYRKKLNAPFWLGEFGSHYPSNASNPEWLLTEQHLLRCEEQVVGWNLWMGETSIDRSWTRYLPFFPLEIRNHNLVRGVWDFSLPDFTGYIVDWKHVDRLEPYRIELWHNGDYVKLKPGLIVRVIVDQRLSDGTLAIASDHELVVTEETIIENTEETRARAPGNCNTYVYPVGIA